MGRVNRNKFCKTFFRSGKAIAAEINIIAINYGRSYHLINNVNWKYCHWFVGIKLVQIAGHN